MVTYSVTTARGVSDSYVSSTGVLGVWWLEGSALAWLKGPRRPTEVRQPRLPGQVEVD